MSERKIEVPGDLPADPPPLDETVQAVLPHMAALIAASPYAGMRSDDVVAMVKAGKIVLRDNMVLCADGWLCNPG